MLFVAYSFSQIHSLKSKHFMNISFLWMYMQASIKKKEVNMEL